MSARGKEAQAPGNRGKLLRVARGKHGRRVLLLVVSAVILTGGAWLLAPRSIPAALSTSIPGVILGSRWVVGVVRLVGVVASLFVVASVVARAWRGQWLVRVGTNGAAVGGDVGALNEDREDVRAELERAKTTIGDLQQQLKILVEPVEQQTDPNVPYRRYGATIDAEAQVQGGQVRVNTDDQ